MALNSLLTELKFQYPFRKYQQMILRQIAAAPPEERKFHLVAPPGSGKTIIGLELIRRFAQPAVVFAPTSTIQLQWRERVKMFLPPEKNLKLEEIVSLNPRKLAAINVFTYQLISVPGKNLPFLQEAAEKKWIQLLQDQGIAGSKEEAEERIRLLRQNNPRAYQRELRRYYKKLKNELWRNPDFEARQFLHPNAQKLIDYLVKAGIRIIVLDEVHHLLDYWALVIKELAREIGDPILIGLTATPPLSAARRELQTYLSLIGSIDFEIPTPAVVKEGNLAPYQDLVFFCRPTAREREFLRNYQKQFQQLIKQLGEKPSFQEWVQKRILIREEKEKGRQEWTRFFNQHPFLAVAGMKYIKQILKKELPGDIIDLEETDEDLTLRDWVYLLTDYSLNYLKLSPRSEDHRELKEIKAVLRAFGFLLTERGLRQYRSPTDLVLHLSEAKDRALVKILRTEMDSLGPRLRAVVITDFEKETAAVARHLQGVLDREAGSAIRAFRYLVEDEKTTRLEAALVTGSTLLVDRDQLPAIIRAMKEWQQKSGLKFNVMTRKVEGERFVQILGRGPDWGSNTYVRMMTALFEKGIIKCLVGTRGILGEGWDSLRLNTLIDLTAATTSQTVNQIRGRSLRLDPQWPQKISNNWDIVCIAPDFARGDQDFLRFQRKQSRFYGLGAKGKIVKGLFHIDESLAFEYQTIGFKRIGFHLVNLRMLQKARQREQAYRAWKIGSDYSNFEYTITKIDAADIKFRTVYTLRDSLKALGNQILLALASLASWYFFFGSNLITPGATPSWFLLLFSLLFFIILIAKIGPKIKQYIHQAFVEVPVDSFLLDIGKALLKTLRETELVSSSLSVDNVRVVANSSGYYDLYLDYGTEEDARTFSRCLRQLLSPVTNQRYLISRSIDNIKIGFYSPFWWLGRKIFRILRQEKVAYHPLPDLLAVNRKRARKFARNWREYVGGGRLIYTRSTSGRRLLLQLRRYNRHKIKRLNYEIWR